MVLLERFIVLLQREGGGPRREPVVHRPLRDLRDLRDLSHRHALRVVGQSQGTHLDRGVLLGADPRQQLQLSALAYLPTLRHDPDRTYLPSRPNLLQLRGAVRSGCRCRRGGGSHRGSVVLG